MSGCLSGERLLWRRASLLSFRGVTDKTLFEGIQITIARNVLSISQRSDDREGNHKTRESDFRFAGKNISHFAGYLLYGEP